MKREDYTNREKFKLSGNEELSQIEKGKDYISANPNFSVMQRIIKSHSFTKSNLKKLKDHSNKYKMSESDILNLLIEKYL